MAVLPDHVKTWQMATPLGSTLCMPAGAAAWPCKYVDTLTRFPLFPWQCLGSSDGVTAGMDGVNRWLTSANLVNVAWPSSSPRSWIVLKNPATGVSWCFHLQPNNTPGADAEMGISISSSFTGGSTTARPTAPDELFRSHDMLDSSTNPLLMCVWHTTDGLQTMMVCQGQTFGGDDVMAQIFQGFIHNVPKGVVSWPKPYWMGWAWLGRGGLDPHYISGNGSGMGVWCPRPDTGAAFSSGPYLASEGHGADPICQAATVGDDGKRHAASLNFFVASNGFTGFCGQWPDLLAWGRSEAEAWTNGGNGNFPDASKKWVQIGRFMYPWNGVSNWVYPP